MKSVTLTIFSLISLVISWIVYASTIFFYIVIPLGHAEIRPVTDRAWLQVLRSFYDNHFYIFLFLFFLASVLVFVRMISKGKNIAIYKVLFYSAFLNFAFGAAGLFFQLGGHGQEVDGFEWITVFGTFGILLVVWYMQATLLFLNKKPEKITQ